MSATRPAPTYCQTCGRDSAHVKLYSPTECQSCADERGRHEGQDQHDFERDHRWGSGMGLSSESSDYRRPEDL